MKLAIAEVPLVREILDYLIRNPRANDTVEGIVRWWLLEQKVQRSVIDAQQALAALVAEELVVAQRGTDGRTHYRLNPKTRRQLKPPLKRTPRQRVPAGRRARPRPS